MSGEWSIVIACQRRCDYECWELFWIYYIQVVMALKKTESKGYRIDDQYGVYFVTFTVVGWVDVFTRKECKHIIVDSLKYCQEKKGLVIYAWVLMSNHMHMVIGAKESSSGLSAIIRDFKKFTARNIIAWSTTSKKESRRE